MAARHALPEPKPVLSSACEVAADTATAAFYEREARRYADVTLAMSMVPQLDEFLAACPVGRILDLGCGAGRDLREMAKRGRDVLGLDRSPGLAAVARSVSQELVVVADLLRPPIAAGALAGVWSSASLLHLPRAQASDAIAEAARMLQPGGVMFSSVKFGRGEGRGADGRLFVFHELKDWGDFFERAGFRVFSLQATAGQSNAGPGDEAWINCLAARG